MHCVDNAKIVSVLDFMSDPDGERDNTAAFQAAHDFLPDGGTIRIPRNANAYRVSAVDITNQNITVECEAGATIKKHGIGGLSARGIFRVLNLPMQTSCSRVQGPASA